MENFNSKFGGKFPISEELYNKIQEIFRKIRETPSDKQARNDVFEIVNELTSEGLDYFFYHSLRIIGMSVIARKAIGAGIKTIKSTIRVLSKKFIKNFNNTQILATVDFIESFLSDKFK